MADELDEQLNQPSEAEKRIKQLSGTVKTTAEERDTARAAAEAATARTMEVERERDFYSGFADVVSTNPQAKDHKDDILAKVKSGYTVEDATYAVLGKAGKLGQVKEDVQVAGGSAANSISNTGVKNLNEMNREEKLAALKEAEARGDLSLT